MEPQEWDTTGQGLGESTMGIRQGRTRTCCDSTTRLVFMQPNSSLTTQRPLLPPQRGGRAFLLCNKGAWVITALPVVSTAGWHKSHWKCLNCIINLQAINFPSLRHGNLIDKPLLGVFFHAPLVFAFVLFPEWSPDQVLWY